MEGIDCATPIRDPAALRRAGKGFACRYLSRTPSKNLTREEADGLRAAGVGIVVVWETTADRALSGRAGGQADAVEANRQACACGLDGIPVYFAVDFDPSLAQLGTVIDYLRGAAGVLGHSRTGVYGGIHTVRAALDGRACRYAWQTYAWSGGAWDARAQLQQYRNGVMVAGISCDLDRATCDDYGSQGAEMPLTPDEITAVAQATTAAVIAKLHDPNDNASLARIAGHLDAYYLQVRSDTAGVAGKVDQLPATLSPQLAVVVGQAVTDTLAPVVRDAVTGALADAHPTVDPEPVACAVVDRLTAWLQRP